MGRFLPCSRRACSPIGPQAGWLHGNFRNQSAFGAAMRGGAKIVAAGCAVKPTRPMTSAKDKPARRQYHHSSHHFRQRKCDSLGSVLKPEKAVTKHSGEAFESSETQEIGLMAKCDILSRVAQVPLMDIILFAQRRSHASPSKTLFDNERQLSRTGLNLVPAIAVCVPFLNLMPSAKPKD